MEFPKGLSATVLNKFEVIFGRFNGGKLILFMETGRILVHDFLIFFIV